MKRNDELRQQYRDENAHHCELCGVLKKLGVKLNCEGGRGLDLHHVVGGIGRFDQWSNFLMICRPAHDWCHKVPREARIVCAWVKLKKGEINEEEFREASGMHLEGAIEIAMSGTDLLPGFLGLGVDVIQELKKEQRTCK